MCAATCIILGERVNVWTMGERHTISARRAWKGQNMPRSSEVSSIQIGMNTDRISQREEWVVASLLDNLDKPWGPNICTAIAHGDYWQNPVARHIARALEVCCHENPTLANISRILGPEYAPWLRHPTFYENGLPLDLAEYEAHDLCVFYRGKRLERIIGDALTKVQEHPEQGKCVAQSLVAALGEFV